MLSCTCITDGCRPETTFESLSKLQPAFQKGGTTTAGNASQVSDGAAAVLVTSRAYAQKHGLPILGTLRSFAVAGTAPEVMGIGPAVAIPAALKQAGLTTKDIDLYEINEAFASQAAYSVKKLGLVSGMCGWMRRLLPVSCRVLCALVHVRGMC